MDMTMSTKERVEKLRREKSFTHRAGCAAREINATMTKYFGRKWEILRDSIFAAILIIGCSITDIRI